MKTSNAAQPKPPSPLKILLLGLPGTRKTTFSLQFPEPHILDCDRNMDGPILALTKGVDGVCEPLLPNLSFTYDDIRLDDNGQMLKIEECFDRVLDKLAKFRSDPAYMARRTVVLDSLSHVNEFIIRKVMTMKGKSSMEIQLWSDFASGAYTLIVARLDQTNKTVICTCHEERVSEPDPKNFLMRSVIEINPLFSGRVGDSLGAYFTDVWRLIKRQAPGRTELWLLTDRDAKCTHLKNSIGLPPEINVTEGLGALAPYLKGRI